MKLTCVHCHATIAHLCPFCGCELKTEVISGHTWYRCDEQLTTIYFDPDNMKTRNGTCGPCAEQILNSIDTADRSASTNAANLAQTAAAPAEKGVPHP